MNLLLPAFALGAWYIWDKQKQDDALQQCEIQHFKLGKLTIGLQETNIPVILDVFNPNNRSVYVDYFRGNVTRAGIKIGDFTFNSDGKSVELKKRSTVPLTFNVRITTIGTIRNLINIFKNIISAKPVDTVFTIDGRLSISGFEVPVNFVWDAKTNSLVKNVGRIDGFADESVLWIVEGRGKYKSSARLDGKRIPLNEAKGKVTSGEYVKRAQMHGTTGLNTMYIKYLNNSNSVNGIGKGHRPHKQVDADTDKDKPGYKKHVPRQKVFADADDEYDEYNVYGN